LPDVFPFRRQPAFRRVRDKLFRGDRRRGVLLIGPKWVGKTELAKQVAQSVLEQEGLPGTQLAYVRLDETKLRGSLSIDEVLAAWNPYRRRDAPALLVLDEAHRLTDPTPDSRWGWARQLKGVIDEGRIEVLATGSDAGRLLEGAGEGAGRWEYVDLEHLSFREFRGLRVPEDALPLDASRHQDFETYLLVGGFPALAVQDQPRRSMEAIQRYAQQVLLDDLGGIRQISKVLRAFAILMDMSGANLDVSSLSKSVGAKPDTIERWLSALESVRLIQRVPRIKAVDRSVLHQVRGQPKTYGTDPGLVAALSRWSDPRVDPQSRGRLFEAAVLRHLREAVRASSAASSIHCLNVPKTGNRRNGEVDFVLLHGDEEMFLVEVTAGPSGIEDKARFLRDVGRDTAICGHRRTFALIVAPRTQETTAGVPAMEAARFLEALVPVTGEEPLDQLRLMSVPIGGK